MDKMETLLRQNTIFTRICDSCPLRQSEKPAFFAGFLLFLAPFLNLGAFWVHFLFSI